MTILKEPRRLVSIGRPLGKTDLRLTDRPASVHLPQRQQTLLRGQRERAGYSWPRYSALRVYDFDQSHQALEAWQWEPRGRVCPLRRMRMAFHMQLQPGPTAMKDDSRLVVRSSCDSHEAAWMSGVPQVFQGSQFVGRV